MNLHQIVRGAVTAVAPDRTVYRLPCLGQQTGTGYQVQPVYGPVSYTHLDVYKRQGQEIYGIFNDPNLPSAITAAATGTSSSTKWADKDTKAIYDDILALFSELSQQSGGLLDQPTPLKLCSCV